VTCSRGYSAPSCAPYLDDSWRRDAALAPHEVRHELHGLQRCLPPCLASFLSTSRTASQHMPLHRRHTEPPVYTTGQCSRIRYLKTSAIHTACSSMLPWCAREMPAWGGGEATGYARGASGVPDGGVGRVHAGHDGLQDPEGAVEVGAAVRSAASARIAAGRFRDDRAEATSRATNACGTRHASTRNTGAQGSRV